VNSGERNSLYARSSTSARPTPLVGVCAAGVDGSASSPSAAFENVAEFSFKSDQAGVEQFPLWHDHDVEPRRELVATKYLSNQSFGPVPDHGAAQLSCGRDPQSTGL